MITKPSVYDAQALSPAAPDVVIKSLVLLWSLPPTGVKWVDSSLLHLATLDTDQNFLTFALLRPMRAAAAAAPDRSALAKPLEECRLSLPHAKWCLLPRGKSCDLRLPAKRTLWVPIWKEIEKFQIWKKASFPELSWKECVWLASFLAFGRPQEIRSTSRNLLCGGSC